MRRKAATLTIFREKEKKEMKIRQLLLFDSDLIHNNEAVVSLILSLLDQTAMSVTMPLSSSDKMNLKMSPDELEGNNLQVHGESLSSLLSSTFSALDTDSDGFLTASDFSPQGMP